MIYMAMCESHSCSPLVKSTADAAEAGNALMQERRKDMAKMVSKLGEDGKIAIR